MKIGVSIQRIMADFYIVKPGSMKPEGPMSLEDIRVGVQVGTIPPGTCYSVPGANSWEPVEQLFDDKTIVTQRAASCPDNYLVWSILTTLFCCMPVGIYAIIKSASVADLWNQGKYEAAQNAAAAAKSACIWSAVLSVVQYMLIGVGGI